MSGFRMRDRCGTQRSRIRSVPYLGRYSARSKYRITAGTPGSQICAAPDGLLERLCQALEGRRGVFRAERNNAKLESRRRLNDDQWPRTPPVIYLVIWNHPETGRKSVFVNPQHSSMLVQHCSNPTSFDRVSIERRRG